MLSRNNFGPIAEQVVDIEESQTLYGKIDRVILNFIQKLLNLDGNVDVKAFALNLRLDGGLEYMLPGAYFKTMQAF